MISPDDLRFFAALVGAPSLAAAARRLDVSPPAVTQRLRALEQRLGAHLVDRAGRTLALTAEGELLAERGRAVLDALEDLDLSFAERRGEVTGHLRVVAPFGFGRRHVGPVVAAFQARHARATVELMLTDRLASLPTGSWDLAVFVGEVGKAPASLIVRTLASNDRVVCAAPAYLNRHAMPLAPTDLAAHTCIALRENDEDVTLWRFRPHGGGAELRIRIEPCLASNDGEVARNWALAGRGIVMRSEWDVAEDIRAGRLIRLLHDFVLPEAPVVALLGSERRARAARTERFLAALKSALDPAPWREAFVERDATRSASVTMPSSPG